MAKFNLKPGEIIHSNDLIHDLALDDSGRHPMDVAGDFVRDYPTLKFGILPGENIPDIAKQCKDTMDVKGVKGGVIVEGGYNLIIGKDYSENKIVDEIKGLAEIISDSHWTSGKRIRFRRRIEEG